MQDSAKSADEVLNSLIKYAKGQGEKGVNNLQKIKDYLGEENNAFLEMQILNKLFKESVVENDRASLRVFDSESFLGRVRELVGENELYERKIGKEFLEELSPSAMPKQISIDEFLNTLENFKNKENFLKHIEKDPKRKDYLNLIEPTLKEPDIAFKKLENGVEKEKFIKKFSDGKDFFYLLATKDNKETILTAFKTDKINTILKEFNADIIPTFIRQGSKGKAAGTTNEGIITQPLFKSKEAREFLELVEGFHKLYKNDASIAKNLVQGTASQLSTSIATSAEGAIKQKVVKGGFDPIFRLLPDKILFGLFAKQIQGGALRYHLKKALSRSLNYDDFKIKLEKELKRTNFNSNTSRLIDEFMQNLEDFNREKEQFLKAKRAEEARIKEEERKRAEEIYQAQEANNLKDILEAEEKPLKDEFGVNFEGFKGKEAIEKLLEEQRGQVKGAFYKEGLGEIDLVWGDENFGLRHILEQRTKQWGEEKALKFISHLNENIEKGQIVEVQKGRAAIKTDLTTIILDKKENNNFVLTAFRDRNNKKELESLNLSQSKTFTSENAEANAKESPVTSLNQESIIAQKAKNDEVLEAEVIEEVGLNEPMKFLEFQQRKLLTYIKENTPLRLLEHKKELKTRDILNFLEQSALNGKQKVFLMRNLERDFTKLKEDFKELESQSFKRDLLDKTKPLRKAEKEELTSEVLEQVQKENLKLYLNDTSGNLTKFLNAKKPFKITMRGANIKHILNRHGENSTLAKNGQPFVNLEDIKKYDEIINNADRQILKENDKGEKTLLSGKQINGHYIVISSVRLKNGELKLKTMYKENGKLENDKAFKSVKLPSETPSVLRGQSLTTDLDGYPSHADESIAQNSQEAKIKEAVKNHNAIYKEILDNDYIFTDERSKIFRKRERELIENLAKDEKVQAFTSQWGYPFKKDGELHGVGLDYKAKVYGKGEHKMMRVSGGGFGSATQQKKQERLLELEKERLQEAFKADFGIDGFISKYVENGFFETLWRETSAYKGTDYGWGVQPREYYPYYENRIMPSDTITQAKEKLQKEKSSWSVKRQETKGSEDIIFTDKKGKEHTLTKETQKAWLEAFNLKSLEDSYIPNHNEAIKQALEGKEIKLQLGSLKKLVAQGREKYIPQIKEVLDRPEAIMRDDMGEYLFIKHLKDDDYFVNVSFDNGEYLVSISNGIKETRNLNNKLKKGGEFIYQSPNFNFISQKLLQTSQYSANKIDEDIIAQNAKSERAEFESFKDKMKELYTKYEALNHYDKSESQLKSKLLNEEIKPEIKKEFKSIIDKFKGADNKDKILRVIKENKEELSDYLAFNIALRKDICIDGHGEGKVDFYDKSIRDFIKLRENKRWSEIDESKYRALVALENLSNKNTSLYFSFKDLNGKVGEIKTYPRIQDLLFYDLPLGDDLKNAVILSTKDKHLKEKLIEKLKAYIDKKIYADFLEYKIKDLESRNPKNSHFENYKDEKWDEEALKSLQKELEDLRAKETQKAWLETFNLKSLEEAYIPNFKAEVKEVINRVLGGEEIKLTKGSFEKLVKRDREEFLPYIKDTLEKADLIIKDKENALIFVKDIGKKSYFTSVAKNANNEWVISTNSLKTLNTLKNRVDDNGELLYLSKEASNILAEAFTKRAFSNELAKDIIPQKPQQKALNLQEIEQALKARKSQINDEISANDKAFKENLKEASKVKPILEALKNEWEALEPTIVTWTHTDYSKAKPKKYYKRKPNLSNLWHIEETLDVYKGYARESDRHANQVAREIALLEKYVKSLKDKEAEVKAFKAKAEADENALILESRIIPIYNQLREAFKKGHHTTKQILEANNIKQDSVQAKEVIDSIAQTRQYLEDTFNIKPLEEFGTNYAEFYRDGKGAVEKLLKEAEDFKQRGEKGEFKGQVAGAFYKEGLGEIDLVWGDSKKGLSHILERRTQDFINQGLEKGKAEYKVRELLSEIPQILENGKILSQNNDKIELITDKYTLVLGLREDKKFIVTELIDKRNKKRLEAMQTGVGDSFTDEPLAKTPLSQNQQEIIPQQKIKFAMEKFNYDEKKAKDLLEWHKNSHALTKDENGLPKVFYHGTYSKFRVFRRVGKASQQGFFFTPSQKATEEYGDITLNTFLNIKNPFRADELKINKEADLQKWADILKLDYDKEKYESFKDLKTKLEKVKEATKKAGFKFHSASGGGVYVIDNKGRNSFINLEELDKENKRVVEAFKGLETEDIYFYYVVRNEFDLVLYALNKNDRYFHTSGRDEVKRVLEKLGYDGVVLNDTIITVFNSNQIKHIDNKGSFTDTKDNVTSKKPKDKEAEFSYFNEKSDDIYHSNPHLGAGLVGGSLNGVEQDENGNLSFDPVKFAMGFLGGAAGSKAVKESIKWRANKVKKAYPNIAKNNPTLMEQIAKRDLLTYAKNETQNALTRLLNKNKLFDSTKGLFAGEKALLNEAYAPHKARLEKAKELEGSGADEIEIWEKTGWYKDKDHKWKFEISQRGGELDLAKIKDKDSEAKLGEILKDDELFKAYPQLRDMSVKHVDLSGNYGFYYVPYNDIKLVRPHIQLDIDEIKTSPYKVKEVLYHEIQHAIQHKEQFAYGLSYMAETYERYLKQHGEVEARNIQERMKNPTKIHPHKTMDTDIEDTIAESALSTEYSEAFSRKLEKSFLDESGRIAYKSLMQNAEKLPKELNLRGFKQMIFNNDKTKQLNAENALIKTPMGEVKVNVLRAFNHYFKQAPQGNKKENRQALNATFMLTLLEPKFVTRDEEGTMYYYKPFISKDKQYHITSIAVKKNGNLDYATSYNATENRL
ncbi:hypothetical protein LL754_001717, partial [Campylobacter upsaliensis]|nr:hypothetical protein [Campylobacter upsaliensis]